MNTPFFYHHLELLQSAKAHLQKMYSANTESGNACNAKANGVDHAKHDVKNDASHTKQTSPPNTISQNPYKQAELCCMAIDNILAHVKEYEATGYIPPHVQEHTVQMLQDIPNPDAIFGLLEDLALITRGHTLFTRKSNDEERALLQAFESAGEWTAGDGTIVSDWYWLRLPTLAKIHEKQTH